MQKFELDKASIKLYICNANVNFSEYTKPGKVRDLQYRFICVF